ncbi:TPA: hypothetical protein ACH3X1_008183 [Trebouxia sp. C0004]
MVCQSIMRSAGALQKTVMDERYTASRAADDMAERIHTLVTDMSFIADMESTLKLLQPILAVLQSLEA